MKTFVIKECKACDGLGGWEVPNPAYLRLLIKRSKLSKAEICRRLKISVVWLFYIETGRKVCPKSIIEKLQKLGAGRG